MHLQITIYQEFYHGIIYIILAMKGVEGLLQFSIYLCTKFGFGVGVNKASLTPILFFEMPVPSQECERPCILMLWVSILPHSTILLIDFEIVPTVCHFFF